MSSHLNERTRTESAALGMYWVHPLGSTQGRWRIDCSCCPASVSKGWAFDMPMDQKANKLARMGWLIGKSGNLCPSCFAHAQRERRTLKSSTAVSTLCEVENETPTTLPPDFPAEEIAAPAPAIEVIEPEIKPEEPMTTAPERRKRVNSTTGEKIAIRMLLKEHLKPIAGTPYFEYDPGWDDGKVAITAWRQCGSRPGAELNANHAATQRKEPDVNMPLKPQYPIVQRAAAVEDRVAKIELFLESKFGDEWRNFAI